MKNILPTGELPDTIHIGCHNWLIWGCVGAFSAIRLNLIGEIYVGEILSLAGLLIFLHRRAVRASNAWILVAGLAYGVSQLLSDLYNSTPFESSIKGVGAPILFCITITVLLTLFERDHRRVFAVLAGAVLSELLQIILWPSDYQQYNPWKWGYGQVTLAAGLIFFSVAPPKRVAFLLVAILGFGAVSMFNNARSLAGLPLIGLAAYAAWRSPRWKNLKLWLQQGAAPLKLALIVVPVVILMNSALGILLTSDWVQSTLAPDAAAKYRQQAQSDVGLLLAGRSEWLVSIQAFLDSPLLGHGSWAEDTQGYLNQYAYLRSKYGISDDVILDPQQILIPSHSFIFGSLVWAGVAGGVFWLFLSYRLVARYARTAKTLPIYFHVGVVLFLWDLLFSPFGAETRWATALFVAALLSFTGRSGGTGGTTPDSPEIR